jgi:hypothetical protein
MDKLFKIIADQSAAPLATKVELAELRRLQGAWQTASDAVKGTGVDSAYNFWLGEQREATRATRAGKLHEAPAHSREYWEDVLLRRGGAAREVMREICAEAAPLCAKIAERFVDTARAVIAAVEKQESESFARFGVSYQPSALVLTLRRVADTARARVPSTGGYAQLAPQQMLPYVTL